MASIPSPGSAAGAGRNKESTQPRTPRSSTTGSAAAAAAAAAASITGKISASSSILARSRLSAGSEATTSSKKALPKTNRSQAPLMSGMNGAVKEASNDGHTGIDESTSTDDMRASTSKIGYEPRTISGLPPEANRSIEAIVWLDIDNTLYKRSTMIADLMADRIRAYFRGMGLAEDEASALHKHYYKSYGLAIRGLVKHHQIDPRDYDNKCDASLPLEDILRPDPQVKRLLSDIDRTKARVYALTNAYRYHADRVLRLLELDDQIEGLVFCDYECPDFSCKPELDFYRQALVAVEAPPTARNYFVDDSSLNIVAAKELGWHSCVYFKEEDEAPPLTEKDKRAAAAFDISSLAPQNESRLAASGGFDEQAIREQFQKLPSHQRTRLLGIILDACLPGDIASMSRALERHLRMTRDVVSNLPDSVALKIFEKLPIQDLLRCRQVSKKWLSLAATPELWRSHALALTEGDPVQVEPPSSPEGWEPLVKGLFFRERNWAKGLAQNIHLLEGHSGFVTTMKLKGRKTLVSGSYDETIRVWDISTGACKKVLKAKAISCLDFLLEQGVLCAGLYDTGRVMVWDMKTWDVIQTLSGHNRGIRNVAINKNYLVSVGQDKAIVVWDWRTGTKVVRFGQQSNVSLGVSLVDGDKLVAVTVDGMIRCFSIPRREMIGQFQLTKLGGPDLSLSLKLGDLVNGSSMLEWFAAHGNTMTVSSKNLVVHLEWQEHVVSAKEDQNALAAEGLRRSASSRLSNNTTTTLSPLRARRDSTQSIASTTAGSPLIPSASNTRARRDSAASTASTSSAFSSARSPRRSLASSASAASPATKPARKSLSGNSANSTAPMLATPSRPRPSPSPKKPNGPAPWPLAMDEPAISDPSGASTPTKAAPTRSGSTASLSFPSTPAMESVGEVEANATRIAPNLSVAPRVVSVLEMPDMATGCVDPSKRRIVASTRFSTRAGAERRLYASSLPLDLGKTTAELADEEDAIGKQEKRDPTRMSSVPLIVSPIVGAWEAHSAELSVPSRNPMTMVLDHESVVVGCADGCIYRMQFVGSKYGLDSLTKPETTAAHIANGRGVGDATITDLLQLREVWKEIFVPQDQPDHPGRLKTDRLKAMGLK